MSILLDEILTEQNKMISSMEKKKKYGLHVSASPDQKIQTATTKH